MNPQYTNVVVNRWRRVVALLFLCAFVFLGYEIVSAVYAARSTGVLSVSTSVPQATISISRTGYAAMVVGNGQTRIRLPQGSYTVVASKNGYQSTDQVTIIARHKESLRLELTKASNASAAINKLYGLLPFQGPSAAYRIDASTNNTDGKTQPVILITYADDSAKANALAWIRSQGFDPANYVIQYQQQTLTNYHYIEGVPR